MCESKVKKCYHEMLLCAQVENKMFVWQSIEQRERQRKNFHHCEMLVAGEKVFNNLFAFLSQC